MRYLKSFNESIDIYNINWHDIVPENITMIYSDKSYEFVCDRNTNIMKHFDMIQITYTIKGGEVWGVSDTLEFDLYFLKPQSKGIKINVDITWGNYMESEFSINLIRFQLFNAQQRILNLIQQILYLHLMMQV